MMANRGYGMGVSEADLRFHETLVCCSRNSKLIQIYRTANLPLTLSQNTFKREDPGRMLEVAGQHRMILEAIRQKDGDRAAGLLKEGMDKGNKD
jgi:DNA-binding GntR family transcriptional regulator